MNYFDKKARDTERVFFNRLMKAWKKKELSFFTGKGRLNSIENMTTKAIYTRAKKGKKTHCISREKLKAAIRFMLGKRTSTRKELEPFRSFNSALMGLLRLVFSEIAKIMKTKTGLLPLFLKGTRYFPSGTETSPSDLEIAVNQGFNFFLMSYFYLRDDKNENFRYHLRRLGSSSGKIEILLDSGALSLYKAEQKGKEVEPISIEEYADFIRKHRDILCGWFNLDVVGDAEASRYNAEYLKAQGLAPIEVWHVQSPWEELERLIEEDHPIIAIGGSILLSEPERDKVFEELFRRYPYNYHFLGGSSSLLYKYEWFSADSKAWSFSARHGDLITPSGHMKAPDHWTAEECITFNAQQLRSLEENYERNYQMQMLIPYIPRQQLALF
jgi:hypothetical protein